MHDYGFSEEQGLIGFMIEKVLIAEEAQDEEGRLVRQALEGELKDRMKVWGEVEKKGKRLIKRRRMGVDERDETWDRDSETYELREKQNVRFAEIKARYMERGNQERLARLSFLDDHR